MKATAQDLTAIRKLQEFDRRRLRAELALSRLPQPVRIRQLQAKTARIQEKRDQIEVLLKRENAAMTRIGEEDAHLVARQKETQEKINEVQGDYRSVNSLTRDLEGIAKRRETIEFESGKVMEKLDEICALADKADAALATLTEQQQVLTDAYQAKAVELRRIMTQAAEAAAVCEKQIPADLLSRYRSVAAKCGGIALAQLDGTHCSACRNLIEENRLLQIKREAPLSVCPNCGRLLIIE